MMSEKIFLLFQLDFNITTKIKKILYFLLLQNDIFNNETHLTKCILRTRKGDKEKAKMPGAKGKSENIIFLMS